MFNIVVLRQWAVPQFAINVAWLWHSVWCVLSCGRILAQCLVLWFVVAQKCDLPLLEQKRSLHSLYPEDWETFSLDAATRGTSTRHEESRDGLRWSQPTKYRTMAGAFRTTRRSGPARGPRARPPSRPRGARDAPPAQLRVGLHDPRPDRGGPEALLAPLRREPGHQRLGQPLVCGRDRAEQAATNRALFDILQPSIVIVEEAGDKVDTLLVPKAGTASDIYMVDCLLSQIETNKKIKNKIGIECLIETALGMSNIKDIAKSSSRLEALHFGVADYAASLRARTVVIGGLNPDYPGDQWHHGLSELVVACRAYGLRAIDGPFGDFNDADAYIMSAKRGAAIGIEGKWAIHPSQIELANKVFTPPESEVSKAKRIIDELDKAAKEGKGAAQLDGRMIDAASARMAENIVNIDKLIHNK